MPSQPLTTDPVLEIAERQLILLAELADMGMVLSRAFAGSGVAAAHAVEEILADEYWQPETGRARALAGARDAADSFQKVARCVRLTFKLQLAVAETVRDLRNGALPARRATRDVADAALCNMALFDDAPRAGEAAERGDPGDESAASERRGSDAERLVEFERPDFLVRAPFKATVERICAEVGAPVDWKTWKVGPADLKYHGLKPKPAGWAENRPPPDYAERKAKRLKTRKAALSP